MRVMENKEPQVQIAENSGFCFGVKRAINLAFEASEKYREIVTLGPIIHNPQMVNKLKEKGIVPIENLNEINNRPVIIRSHGIEKNDLKRLELMNVPVIDATCPFVASSQEYATKLSRQGYTIIIIGNKMHPEVIALKSYINGNSFIILSPQELPRTINSKLAVICQTTQSIDTLFRLTNYLLPQTKELRIINSICTATTVRQQSTLSLSQHSDLMIVIGGKNSSNTRMLYNISQRYVETRLIEVADELNCNWLRGKKRIGLTAGASTPDWIIVEIYNKIMKCLRDSKETVHYVDDIPGYREERNELK